MSRRFRLPLTAVNQYPDRQTVPPPGLGRSRARRQFFKVYRKPKSLVAAEAQQRIGRVYEIEERIRGLTAAETKSVLVEFRFWLMQCLADESAKSVLAKAISYMLNHWDGLTVFLNDGPIEVDSNTVERTIRPIVLGRRHALFAGSLRGAEAWAILASIINTAKLDELDPQTYLADLLDQIVSGQSKVNALRQLLPRAWKAA
jgi:transposase